MSLVIQPLVRVLVGFFIYAYLKSHSMTGRPGLVATAAPKPSFLKTAAFLYKASGIKWVLHVTHVSQAIASRFALAHFPLLTMFLNGHAMRVNGEATEFAHLSSDTSIALGTLRHHTMPHAINAKVAPVKARATHADHAADRALGRVRAEEKARRRSISLTNKRLGALASLLLGADLFVFGKHALTHHRHHVHTIPDIEAGAAKVGEQVGRIGKVQARHTALLKRLAKLLTVAGFGALLWRVLLKWKLGWLRCSKVRQVGSALCGLDQLLIDGFLLEAGLLTTPFSIEAFARLMATPTRELLGGLHFLVSEVEHFTTTAEGIWTKGATTDPVPDL